MVTDIYRAKEKHYCYGCAYKWPEDLGAVMFSEFSCNHPALAREGIPPNHVRCVKCNAVFKEEFIRVGEFDRTTPDGIRYFNKGNEND
jgi:hypothetical protein